MSFVGMGFPVSAVAGKPSVMVGCLLVGVKDSDSRFQEKPSQHRFVPGSLAPGGKSRPQLAHDYERQPDRVGRLNNLHRPSVPATQIRIANGCRARASPPQLRLDGFMRRAGAIKGAVFPPGSGDVVKVTLSYRASGEAAPRARASMATSLRLLPCSRAQRRKTVSRVFETFRMVYCMQLL